MLLTPHNTILGIAHNDIFIMLRTIVNVAGRLVVFVKRPPPVSCQDTYVSYLVNGLLCTRHLATDWTDNNLPATEFFRYDF